MSRGFFDWVPESIGLPFVRMAVSIEINPAMLTIHMRSKLIRAIESGILPSYSGQLAAIYRTFAAHYKWPEPHLWTRSEYGGCKFFVRKSDWTTHIAPFIAVLAPAGYGPRYEEGPTSWGREAYGTLAKADLKWPVLAEAKGATPDAIVDAIKKLDTRDQSEVAAVLEALHNNTPIHVKKLIS